MSEEFSAVKYFVKEVLIDLMIERVISERVISVGVQASSMRGVKASSLTSRGDEPSRPLVEKRTKQRDDLENMKLIPTIFPNYILPLVSVVS
jgi:hypothetical protein